jgi:acyl carrier protein
VLAGVWAEVLARPRVGRDDDFFALGGHSLLATQVVSRIREAFQIDLPMKSLFDRATLARLAAQIEEQLRTKEGGDDTPLVPVSRDRKLPLSYAQQQLWFLHQLAPEASSYNMPMAFRLRGTLDAGTLARSLGEIVRRHEVLRTVFGTAQGSPDQEIRPWTPLALPVLDLRSVPAKEKESEIARQVTREARRPFDLARGPLLRAALLRVEDDEQVLLLTLHHIACDGWSLGLLLHEMVTLYESLNADSTASLPPLPVQYADFAVWQRELLAGAALERLLDYWKERLRDLPVLQLPLDRPRPEVPSPRGDVWRFEIPTELTEALRALARREGATLFMILLAAFNALLHTLSGQEDIVIGSDVAGRSRVQLEPLIGFFVNQVVLRTDLSGNPGFLQLLARVREVTLGAYAHQDLPFDRLVEALKPERSLALTPLFQAKLVLQSAPGAPPRMERLEVAHLAAGEHEVKFDLLVNVKETAGGLAGNIEYRRDLFEPATMRRLEETYRLVLQTVAAEPAVRLDRLRELAGEAERRWRDQQQEQLRLARLAKIGNVRRKEVQARPASLEHELLGAAGPRER